jgi:hypothetical protein
MKSCRYAIYASVLVAREQENMEVVEAPVSELLKRIAKLPDDKGGVLHQVSAFAHGEVRTCGGGGSPPRRARAWICLVTLSYLPPTPGPWLLHPPRRPPPPPRRRTCRPLHGLGCATPPAAPPPAPPPAPL